MLVPVEEVLHVYEDPPAFTDEEGNGVSDHRLVLFERGFQGLLHVPHVGLRHQGDDRGTGVQQGPYLLILGHCHPCLAGGAEGDQLRMREREFVLRSCEELGVFGQGAGPSALDEANAVVIEQSRHREFVDDRVRDALALGTIAQGRVVDVKRVALGKR